MTEDELNNQEMDIELCLGCLYANEPGTHFCSKCNTPLSSLATIGPWERLQAQRHIYANAASNPQRLISVIGIWLIFGNMFLMGTCTTILTIYSLLDVFSFEVSLLDNIYILLFGLFIMFVGGFVTIRTTINSEKNSATSGKLQRTNLKIPDNLFFQ